MSRDEIDLGDETLFNQVSETEYSMSDRVVHLWSHYIRAPVSVLVHDWRSAIGLFIIGVYLLMATIGVAVVRPPRSGQVTRYKAPFESWSAPLGSNYMGQDELSLVVHGTPTMIQMMVAGALFTVILGTVWGTVSGYVGGRVDQIMMTISDTVMTIPGLPLVLVLATLFTPKHAALIGIIVVINSWAGLSRMIRSEVLSMNQLGYVKASRTIGLSTQRIIIKDIIPNILPYIAMSFVRTARSVIYASVALYFLGVLPYSAANWGVMLNSAYQYGAITLPYATHVILIPIVAIMGMSLSLTLLAQGADKMFNPRLRTRHQGGTETGSDRVDPGSTK